MIPGARNNKKTAASESEMLPTATLRLGPLELGINRAGSEARASHQAWQLAGLPSWG